MRRSARRVAIARSQDADPVHDLIAGWAAHVWPPQLRAARFLLWLWRSGRDAQQLAHSLQRFALARTEKAVVAHLAETLGQDMLQEATDELLGADGAGLLLAALAVLVGKGNLAILQLDDTAVADRDPKDIRRQILERCCSITHRLAVDDPVLAQVLLDT